MQVGVLSQFRTEIYEYEQGVVVLAQFFRHSSYTEHEQNSNLERLHSKVSEKCVFIVPLPHPSKCQLLVACDLIMSRWS